MKSEPAVSTAAKVEPTAAQIAYVLRTGKRFRTAPNRIVTVIEVYSDWTEICSEDNDGNTIAKCVGLPTTQLRASLLQELPELSRQECERRGYR